MAESNEVPKPNHRKRNIVLTILAVVFLIVGIAWFLYWIFIGRFYVYTDDAYIFGNQVTLNPQVTGGVVAIYADNTNLVEKGQLVVELDRTPFELDLETKKAALAETVRSVAQLFENVKEKEATLCLRWAELKQKQIDFDHRKNLWQSGAISIEEFEQSQTDVAVALASFDLAERQVISSKLMVEGTTVYTHPDVQKAKSALRQAFLNLIRTRILSPVTGYIAKRSVQVGDQVIEGQTLLSIVPLDFLWLEANYKETQLKYIRAGQPVRYTADLYGREVEYEGKVLGFSAGTGSAFALLPAENASGNWIKIVQRLPIRISIDPEALRKYPLMIGLSMHVYVDIHDTQGYKLPQVPTKYPVYTTEIFDSQATQLADFDPMIEEIIERNLPQTVSLTNLRLKAENPECQ